MSEPDLELEAFSKFIVAMEPWLGEVVLVGGWAHRLYRVDPRARKLDYVPLTTLDGDVAVPLKLKKEESTVRIPRFPALARVRCRAHANLAKFLIPIPALFSTVFQHTKGERHCQEKRLHQVPTHFRVMRCYLTADSA